MKKELQLIENDHASRMKEILDDAWEIFKWQFVHQTFNTEINSEAGFQFYFASIIKNIGEMLALNDEVFFLEVETKWNTDSENGNERIDITCGFKKGAKKVYACAIELKFFKDGHNSTHNLFSAYEDLYALEKRVLACGEEGITQYSQGRFYLVTGSSDYRNNPAYKNKTDDFPEFGFNNDVTVKYVKYRESKTRPSIELRFKKEYEVCWSPKNKNENSKWHFLEIDITE